MTLKKHTPPPEDGDQQNNSIVFPTEDQAKAMTSDLTGYASPDPSTIDSSEPDIKPSLSTSMFDLTAAVAEAMRQNVADSSMSSVPAAAYKTGGVSVTAPTDVKAYQGQLSQRDREDLIQRLQAGTATKDDMANVDESMIMDLPAIKASDFSIPGQYSPKPKDPATRFRWVNCVNALQSNMQRFLALGFVLATPDDVDQVRTPLADSMIQGTQIKQYDVVLMKIPVMQLMALYKKNVLDSLYKLDSIQQGGVASAQQTFSDLVGQDPAARSGYNKTRIASGREPVTFNYT